MASGNKTLGRFHLDNIPPAPRGTPQIEVTFDIDANGIVNVTAKDLGTGKEQHITLTSSSNMSKDDIDKAIREAEQFASEDKKRREEADIRNGADQAVFAAEKLLSENADKISDEHKTQLGEKKDALGEAIKGTDIEAVKTAQEELQKVLYEVSAGLYKDAQPQGAPGGADGQDFTEQSPPPGDDGFVDADYKEIKED